MQITASDADDSDHTHGQVVYSMDADASFDINSESGEIRTLVALDYETTTSYTLTVYAKDRYSYCVKFIFSVQKYS